MCVHSMHTSSTYYSLVTWSAMARESIMHGCSHYLLLPHGTLASRSCTAGVCLYQLGAGIEGPSAIIECLAACGSVSC